MPEETKPNLPFENLIADIKSEITETDSAVPRNPSDMRSDAVPTKPADQVGEPPSSKEEKDLKNADAEVLKMRANEIADELWKAYRERVESGDRDGTTVRYAPLGVAAWLGDPERTKLALEFGHIEKELNRRGISS